MRIIVDQDEVLAQWLNRVLEWYNEDKKTSYTRDQIPNWDVVSCLPNSEDFVRSILRYPEFYRDLDPVPGAVDGMKALIDDGHDVIIATASPKFAGISYHGKLEWIRRCMPFFDLDNFVSIKRKDLLIGDVLLDDGPHNLKAWRDSGRCAVTFDHAWNKNLDGPRVKDWSEFVQFIKKIDSHVYGLQRGSKEEPSSFDETLKKAKESLSVLGTGKFRDEILIKEGPRSFVSSRCSVTLCSNTVSRGTMCEDCMYDGLGDLIESHPIGGGGIRRS